MSNQYAGGFISKTPPAVTTSSAQGMWTLSQAAQYKKAGVWPAYVPPPTVIGQAYGGGFYAGKISTTANGVATHYLVVAPKSTGENSSRTWGTNGVTTGITSDINGPTNTTSLVALGANYQAAIFCNNLNSGGGLNGYTDWYLPAKNELEVLYYFLKPTTDGNNTSYGSNANAVSPEPVSQNYTSASIPARTSAGIGFRLGETNAFVNDYYWSSSEVNSNAAFRQGFDIGNQISGNKFSYYYVRAVRRIPV
jgi:hypothetical protein